MINAQNNMLNFFLNVDYINLFAEKDIIYEV